MLKRKRGIELGRGDGDSSSAEHGQDTLSAVNFLLGFFLLVSSVRGRIFGGDVDWAWISS
jgi:hypothetical protein